MKLIGKLGCAVLALGISSTGQASDHFDGITTSIDRAADLSDLFVFTSPEDASKLVLILNVHPLAGRSTKFSNSVDYKFRVRPIDDKSTLLPSSDPRREGSIVCTFSGGGLFNASQDASCAFNLVNGRHVLKFSTRGGGYLAGGEGVRAGARVFAGVRSDPWFLDLAKTLKYNAGYEVSPGGSNGLANQNVLSIVVEVDKTWLPGPLLAVTAQTVRK